MKDYLSKKFEDGSISTIKRQVITDNSHYDFSEHEGTYLYMFENMIKAKNFRYILNAGKEGDNDG